MPKCLVEISWNGIVAQAKYAYLSYVTSIYEFPPDVLRLAPM